MGVAADPVIRPRAGWSMESRKDSVAGGAHASTGATRAQAGDFLSLCYNSDLAAEVTLQPIRRYGFDAAILFADILLLPQAREALKAAREDPAASVKARARNILQRHKSLFEA